MVFVALLQLDPSAYSVQHYLVLFTINITITPNSYSQVMEIGQHHIDVCHKNIL